MEVKPGYKQTEVGVIPEDWGIYPLSKVIESLDAGVSVNSVNEQLKTYGHEQLILKTSAVNSGQFIPQESKKISPQDIGRAKLNPRADTIIISRMNTPDLVGECGYVESDHQNLYLPDRLWMTRKHSGNKDCMRWLNYVLSSKLYRAKLKGLATGTSGSMKNIAKDALLALSIAFPPAPEQRAIATALSDVDALLDGLDRLIAKKRDLKQAAMQQLLTGKTRLPGFEGEWEETSIGKLAALRNGYTFKSSTYTNNGLFRVITIANVQDGRMDLTECNTINDLPNDLQPHHQLHIGDLLISMTGNVGRVCRVTHSLCLLNQRVGLLCPITVSGEFLFHVLSQRSFLTSMFGKAKGGAQGNLSKSDISDYTLLVPTDPKEQTAIAAVLSDMDAEIAALEQRRNKTKDIKQAMMQELLTGKTRLVTPGGSNA